MRNEREMGCCVDRRYESPRGCTPVTCMVLPDLTCADCWHCLSRCGPMGFTSSPKNGYCSFFPRRFSPWPITVNLDVMRRELDQP